MFQPPEEASDPSVLGVYFHEGDYVTLMMNQDHRDTLRLSLEDVVNVPAMTLQITEMRTGTMQRLTMWRNAENKLSATINNAGVSCRLSEFARCKQRACRTSEVTAATGGVPQYLCVVSARDGVARRRHAYYTTSCLPSPETEWAMQHFAGVFPESEGMEKWMEFHAAADIGEFVREAKSVKWWVYLAGEPKLVESNEATRLFNEKQITHVCPNGSESWQTREQAVL